MVPRNTVVNFEESSFNVMYRYDDFSFPLLFFGDVLFLVRFWQKKITGVVEREKRTTATATATTTTATTRTPTTPTTTTTTTTNNYYNYDSDESKHRTTYLDHNP